MASFSTSDAVFLKMIVLYYDDGTQLIIKETKANDVGTKFFELIKKENIDWEIKRTPKAFDKLKSFFKI